MTRNLTGDSSIERHANERVLVIDGAMGTMIQAERPDEATYRGARFADHPSALASTLEIAERCNVELGIDTGHYHMPEFQVPAGRTREQVLEAQAWRGLRERLRLESDEERQRREEDERRREEEPRQRE